MPILFHKKLISAILVLALNDMVIGVKYKMTTSIIATLITAFFSIIGAAFTFYLTKRHQIKSEWQQQKLNHYKVLLSSLSDLAVDNSNKEAKTKFALASNTIALVAPQNVILSLMTFYAYLKSTEQDRNPDEHDLLLKKLLLAIRKDIGLSKKDNIKTFDFHLIK